MTDAEQRIAIAKVVITANRRMLTEYQGTSTNENALWFGEVVMAALDGLAYPKMLGLSGGDAERVRAIVEGRE